MGEREQKRLYHAPLADSIAGNPYPWVYYLLGGSKDQLAVWHGQQMTSPFCDTVKFRNVFLYPTEYLTYGVGKQSSLITKPDGSKEYRFFDHLGSSRAVKGASGFTFSDYAPFGGLLAGGNESRKGFIGKEKDEESSLRNLGVRQYNDEAGRFLSVDALWEKYRGWSPYGYALDNPLMLIDASGLSAEQPNTGAVAEVSGDQTEEVSGKVPRIKLRRAAPRRPSQSRQRDESNRRGQGNQGTSPPEQAQLQRKVEETQTRNNPWERMERNSAQSEQTTPALANRGSTVDPAKGRFFARDLREQLAIGQAMSNPTAGIVLPIRMTDPRWPASEGWVKMQQVFNPGGSPINVHYVRNTGTGAIDDFKIVGQP